MAVCGVHILYAKQALSPKIKSRNICYCHYTTVPSSSKKGKFLAGYHIQCSHNVYLTYIKKLLSFSLNIKHSNPTYAKQQMEKVIAKKCYHL